MPITFVCYSCGKTLRAPDATAGRDAKCNGCGAKLSVPVPESAIAPDLPPIVTTAPTLPAPEPTPSTRAVVASSWATAMTRMNAARRGHLRPGITPEPWYYSVLITLAWVVFGLSVAQFLFVIVSFSKDTNPAILIYSALWMIAGIIISAAILLVVDVARNVRAVRWNTRRRKVKRPSSR